jgi:hypothetical protein
MGKVHRTFITILLIFATVFTSIGYASVSDNLSFFGQAEVPKPWYDLYISNITPDTSGGVDVTGYYSTYMSAEVGSSKTATFTVTVVNQSNKIYCYERIIEGEELGLEGVYTGDSIRPSVKGITFLQEVAPGESVTFTLTMTNADNDKTDNYYLKFNFVEKATHSIPEGLFITAIDTNSTTNVDSNEVNFIEYSTTINSTINRGRTTNKEGIVEYKVTVYNNTKLTYTYRDFYYQTNLEGYNGNNSLSTTNNKSKIGVTVSLAKETAAKKIVPPGGTLDFTVTYVLGTRMDANTDWATRINLRFGINVDGEREALEVVEKKFLDILNTKTTYDKLIDAIDNKYDGYQEWTSNYIGNVVGSSSEDSVALSTLFAGQLQISVGKDQIDATVLVKHENLDGNRSTGDDYVAVNKNGAGSPFYGYGCEMTLYLTVDPLNRAGAYVPVYAVVFTCDRDANGNKISDWYRIGSTYAGTANVVKYDGGNGTGSFVTDNWVADAATYKLVDGYSYNIGGDVYNLRAYSHSVSKGVSIKNIVVANDANAVNTLKTLANDAKRIMEDTRYAGEGVDIVAEVYERYSYLYTANANGTHSVRADLTIAQMSPAIVNLYDAVNKALMHMDAGQKDNQ